MDNFGLPLAFCRASRFLDHENVRDRVSLLAGGGLESPGDFLKAFALGADGVYIGTIALIAITHTQVFKALPYETPIKAKKNPAKCYDEDQMLALLDALEHALLKYQVIVDLAPGAGLRRGEIMGLEWKDINLELCTLEQPCLFRERGGYMWYNDINREEIII